MISVNLFADLLGWDERTQQRMERSVTAAQTLFVSGARKAQPAACLLDAATAIMDAIDSYAQFRQATEVTRQLELERDTLERELKEIRKRAAMDASVTRDENDIQEKQADQKLARRAKQLRLDRKALDVLAKRTQALGAEVSRLRLEAPPYCPRLLELERSYYQFVDAQLDVALTLMED